MFLLILALILPNLTNTKIIRPQMKLFEAPHSLYLYGSTERIKHLIEEQTTSKVMMTNIASAAVVLPLNISIDMIITPFEEIFMENQQKVFSVKSTIIDNSTVILHCTYEKGKKLKIIGRYTNKNKGEIVKEIEHVIQPLGWNKVSFNLHFEGEIVPAGDIKTIVQFQEEKPVFKGIVTNFSMMLNTEISLLPIILKKEPTEWIGTVDPISHPISLKGLVLPQSLKSNKPPHTIPILSKGRKLLVCHDMMNGYKEDINEYSNKFGKNAYRFNHWRITDLFVYFSHENIAIPPKHYRQLCKRQKVVCLATFIIEAQIDWLKFQMADFLIYLARQYEFDGYLINIEYPLFKPDLFKDWLTYLTKNIHQQLTNSLIVLYDAITNDGSLSHQSGISNENIDFMSTVDYFFTDYHWTLQSLQNTAALSESIERGFDVFMGNDVFGRGTWGGGIFNTDVAVKEINKYNLSTAIFAPGYVYENEGGNENYSRFEQLDDKLWFGKSFNEKEIKYEDWNYLSKGWKKEGDDAVTSAMQCIRSYTYPLANNNEFTSISLSVYVKGTPPNTKDPYTIALQLLDENNNSFKFVSAGNGNGYQFAKQNWQQIKLRIEITEEDRKKVKSVKILESGRDAENWGGHYGSRFKGQTLFFNYVKKGKSISSSFYERPQTLPYQSFYNIGVGPNYFFKGEPIIKDTGYTFLADYDLPYQNKNFYSIDEFAKSSNLQVNYDQSRGWIGAGSLKIESNNGSFALRLVKVEEKLDNIFVRLMIFTNSKQLFSVGFKFKDLSTRIVKCESISKGLWQELNLDLKLDSFNELESVYLVSQSNESNVVINIGQIALFTSKQKYIQNYNPQLVTVRCSISSLDCIDLYVNMKQFPVSLKTIFIQVDGKVIGTLYEKTGYFEEITGDPNNINIRLLGLAYNGDIEPIYNEQITTKPQ